MPLFGDYGGPQYGLSDVKIAAYTATNTYGTLTDVPSAQMFSVTLRVVSAELTGDDRITATASRVIGANVQMRNGSVNIDVLEVMLGNAATSSVLTPNEVKNLRMIGGDRLPYFGVVGKVLAEEGLGDMWLFLPKVRIVGDIVLANAEYGSFIVPEMTATGVDDETHGVVCLVMHETAATITIPPANIPEIA